MRKLLFAFIASFAFMACGGNATDKASVNDSDTVIVDSIDSIDSIVDSTVIDSIVVAE